MLAGLRFVLASIIAVNHLGGYVELGGMAFIPMLGAFEAVLGFLLVSGYSVGTSYIERPKGFMWRRIIRIYPVYIISIFITILVNVLILRQDTPSTNELLINILLLNQIFTDTSLVGPAWSLSLEFWLYMLVPALMKIGQSRTRSFVFISFFSYLVYTACRTLLHLPYYSGVTYGANFLLLSFIWICGVRLAHERGNHASILFDIRLIFFVHILYGASIQFISRLKHRSIDIFINHDVLIFTMQSLTLLLTYIILLKWASMPTPSGRSFRLLKFLGDVSYPLFLIHIPVYIVLARTPLTSPFLYFAISVVVAGALLRSLDALVQMRRFRGGPN